jgi:hypothetical protein
LTARNDERWKSLCEQASQEKDPNRLMELVNQINNILSENDSGGSATDVPAMTPKAENAA